MPIYVIGHKSPDLDSVTAAISYANFKNRLEQSENYIPAIAGEINGQTKYALEKFGFPVPELITDARGKEFVLVDHNESQQSADGMAEAKIREIVDHHKVDFKYGEPIYITTKPWGSSNSLITEMYFENNIAIENGLAGLMLAAILDDTVITKSPTCTDKDREVIEKLSMLAGIQDWEAFGMEMFKKRSNIDEMTDEQMVKGDFKDFNFKAGKFGTGQIETVDPNLFTAREDSIYNVMNKIRETEGYHSVVFLITDIIKEGSQVIVSTSDPAKIEEAFGVGFENNKAYIPGMMSRKKQVTPKLMEVFDK